MNKLLTLSFIFSLLIIPGSSFATLSEESVMSRYANPQALQNAIDNGEVNYNDLPPSIQKAVHDKVVQAPITQLPDIMSNIIFVPIIAVVLIISIVLLLNIFLGREFKSDEEIDDSEEKTTSKTEDKVTKVSMDNIKTKEDHPMGDKTHD